MVQNGSNMAPKSTQVGAMLGSKIVLSGSKSEKKQHRKRDRDQVQKPLKKQRPGNRDEATAGSGAESKWPPQGGWGAT